ncbi:MAG: glycosyltransferase family 4 protein [Planctomycetales bacterium]|nr:glycosyltransferase family 4 protein [Planctomycetales bacterium]
MNAMRVALDARMADRTGIGRYVRLLVRHLAALDACDLTVLLNPGDSGAWLPASPRVSLAILPARVPVFSWREHWTLPRAVRRLAPDVLHVPNWNAPARPPVPLVATIHDLIYFHWRESCPSALGHRYARWGLRRVARVASRLVAVSAATRDEAVRDLGADPARVRVVHHGPPLDAPGEHGGTSGAQGADGAGALPALGGIPDRYLLYVGTFAPHKNLPALLEGVAGLRAAGTPAHLVVVGPRGRHGRAVDEAVARLSLREGVTFLGEVGDPTLRTLYERAGALALPSRAEGFGFTPLEAFAHGCPVVASDIPVLREVAGDGALLVPPGDAGAWRDALRRVLTEAGLRESLAGRGRARLGAFSWERAARETLAVYEEAAGTAP